MAPLFGVLFYLKPGDKIEFSFTVKEGSGKLFKKVPNQILSNTSNLEKFEAGIETFNGKNFKMSGIYQVDIQAIKNGKKLGSRISLLFSY